MSLLALILIIVAFGLIFWAVNAYAPIPQPFKNIVLILIIVFLALVLLNAAGVVSLGSMRLAELSHSFATLRA